MRVESKVRYRISLKHDNGVLMLNPFNDNGLLLDGITQVDDKIWENVYKNNHAFLDKCEARGSITWKKIYAEKADKDLKQAKKAKNKVEVDEGPVVEKDPAVDEAVELKAVEDNDFIEG